MDNLDKIYSQLESIGKSMKAGAKGIYNSSEKLSETVNNLIQTPLGLEKVGGLGELLTKSFIGKSIQGKMKNIAPDFLGDMGGYYMDGSKTYFESALEFDQTIRNVNRDLGNSGELSSILQQNFVSGAQAVANLGIKFNDVVDIQKEYNNLLKTARSLREDEIEIIGRLAEGSGLEIKEASRTISMLEKYGNSAKISIDAIEEQVELSRKFGVNSLRVLKDTRDTVKTAQSFTFKNGLEGLTKMVAEAASLRVNVGDTFKLMDSARGLEGAFEIATKLQMMGKNVDALRLNFLARNDPEEFQREINSLLDGFGRMNKMGQLELSPVDIDILREMGKITNQSVADLKEQIVQRKKFSQIKSANRLFNDEDVNFLANMSSMKDGKLMIQVADGGLKDINNIVQKDIDTLKKQVTQNLNESVLQSQGFKKQQDVASASAIASTMDFIDNITSNLDTLRNAREDATRSLVNDFGMASKSAQALSSGFIGATANLYKEGFMLKTGRSGGDEDSKWKQNLAVISQEILRGTNTGLSPEMMSLKESLKVLNSVSPTTKNLYVPSPVGGNIDFATVIDSMNSMVDETKETTNRVVNDMGDVVKSTIENSSNKLDEISKLLLKMTEKQGESIKEAFKEALDSTSTKWPIQTIKLLIDMKDRDMDINDVKRIIELYEQSRQSGTGN